MAAAFLSCTVILFWLPYLIKPMKNVEHRCGNEDCGVRLATWHRSGSGGVEVHYFE
jgi:LITAF-like zinc ribbon domain